MSWPLRAFVALMLLVATTAQDVLGEPSRIQRAEEAIRERQFVRARELATAELRDRPQSPRAEFVLAQAYHEGEGNMALALRHFRRARELSENRAGLAKPGLDRKHREILYHLMYALSDLGEYEEVLEVTDVIRQLYDPHIISSDIWPLMKLGRREEARESRSITMHQIRITMGSRK